MSEGLPFSEEAEVGVLGACLLDPGRVIALARVEYGVLVEDFFLARHQTLFRLLLDMDAEPRTMIDVLTVGVRLENAGELEAVGGRDWLLGLMDRVPTAAHAGSYLDTVKQKALLRRVIEQAHVIVREAKSVERADELIRGIPERFVGLGDEVKDRTETNAEALDKLVVRWEKAYEDREAGREPELWGLPTPWPEFNRRTLGVDTGLTIIAGRPSAGKTTMEDALSVFWAQSGIPVARVALDMGWKGRLLQRAACRMASVSLPKLKAGYATKRQMADVREACEELKLLPMYINEHDSDVDSICSWARAMAVKYGVQVLTIDFAQLLTARSDGKYMNRNEEVGIITRKLKRLYTDIGVRVVLLSQLARITEKNGKERPPVLSDLRDSGNLEQDAQSVWALWVDQKVVRDLVEPAGQDPRKLRPVICDVLKQQDGECFGQCFWQRAHYFRFDVSGDDFATVPGQKVASGFDWEAGA